MLFQLYREYARTHPGALAGVLLAQFAAALCDVALPTLNADIIDRGITAGNIALVWRLGAIMLAVTAVQAFAATCCMYLTTSTTAHFGASLRARIFRRVQGFAAADLNRFGAPSLIVRSTNDVSQIQLALLMSLELMIAAIFIMVGAVVMAVRQDPHLALLLAVIVPVIAATMGTIVVLLLHRYPRQQRALDAVSNVVRSQLAGARVIRAFVRERTEATRFDAANAELRRASLAIGMVFSTMMPALMLIVNVSLTGFMWISGARVDAGSMKTGTMTAFITYILLIYTAIMLAGFAIFLLPRASVCAKRVNAVVTQAPSIASSPNSATPGDGTLTFSYRGVRVGFKGAAKPVLDGIDLTLRPSTTTAIIGATGAGKTTLVALLARLRDPDAGTVTVNGMDLREVDLAELRRRIGYVPQHSYLFSGTIAETVCGIHAEATETREAGATRAREDTPIDAERLAAALEVAQAGDFAADTTARVQPGGTNFSGGQRQRLAIARALYRKADLYVFDDCFSALDFATEARLRARLRDHVGLQAAIVVVSQRVDSIREADNIVVLDRGRIVGSGTHAELLAGCEVYRQIVESQSESEEAQ